MRYGSGNFTLCKPQNKYAEVKNELFSIGASGLTLDYLNTIPDTFSLDSDAFQHCLKNTDVHNSVTLSAKYASEMGLGDTPAFVIGRIDGDTVTDYEIIVGAKA
ncbi:hypothetical protein [Rheinheimera sp. MMS21-TC3]|uniref:DsbA family protein n=1 Tax=Rheinheimera sp. MMS21-TC3 TaxID=3072790 RepID=UPI0028C3A808|nr:hypothetical protein [Rheinheimera sp. MMS21-TC3]WNO59400.1 hypothetical protein RDV63_00080 [Rheinheimera sp. MMS21-TC3]